MNLATGVLMPQAIHSRGPRRPLGAGLMARSANVIGVPITSRIGAIMDSTMCWSMWMLKSTGE